MKPRIEIPKLLHQKIMHMCRNQENIECSALCQCEIRPGGVIAITDTFMTKQKNASSSTELDPDGIGKAMFVMKDKPGALRGHWHSHVDMGVFWSSTDMDMIKQNAKHAEWFVHLVFNKKGDVLACLYVKEPVELFIDQIEVMVIEEELPAEVVEAWNKEYADAVTVEGYAGYAAGHSDTYGIGYGGYGGSRDYGVVAEISPKKSEVPVVTAAPPKEIAPIGGQIQGGHLIADPADTQLDTELQLERQLAEVEIRLEKVERELYDEDDAHRVTELQVEYWELSEKKDAIEAQIEMVLRQEAYLVGGLQ